MYITYLVNNNTFLFPPLFWSIYLVKCIRICFVSIFNFFKCMQTLKGICRFPRRGDTDFSSWLMCQCWWNEAVAPCDRLYVFVCCQRGMYLPQTYIIQEEMAVTGRIRNMRQLGPFIHRLCYGKETYRLRRRSSQRREFQDFLIYYFCMRRNNITITKIEINMICNVLKDDSCAHQGWKLWYFLHFFSGFLMN